MNKAVVVGAGIAGVAAAETIRKFAPQADITLVSAETHLPYYRLNLTRYLAGEIHTDQLSLHPEIWYNIHNIRLLRDTAAQALDLGNKDLIFSDENRIPFDRLVLKYKDKVFNLCFRINGDYDEANDCSQETFIKVFNNLANFKFRSSFSTWLYRIAVNTCKNNISSLTYRMKKKMTSLDNPGNQLSQADSDYRLELSDNSFAPDL